MTTTDTTPGAAIVTGASRGLGRGVADALAAAGHPVVLVARDSEALERTASELPDPSVAIATDVTDEVAMTRLATQVRERFGEIAVLVNAAGAPPVVGRPDELTWERWRTPIDVDVRGVFHAVRALAPLLGEEATIVNVASGAVALGSPMHTSYSPGQAALLSLSRCLGAWLAPRGIVTHCLCPSLSLAGEIGRTAATAFGAATGQSAEEWMHERFGDAMLTPEQTGQAVLVLCAERDGADWMLGPGGLTAWQPLARPVERA